MSYKSYEQSLRAAKYILQMRPVFNGDALFSDETENYVSPMEPKPRRYGDDPLQDRQG